MISGKRKSSSSSVSQRSTTIKVSSLLDPIQFQYLGALFVNAASYIIETLPNRPKAQNTQQPEILFYIKLKELQNYRKQLDIFCYQLYQLFQECYNHGLETHSFLEELTQLTQKSLCYQLQSLENPWGIEICYLEIQQLRTKIKDLIQIALDKCHQIEDVLNEQIKFLETQSFLENYKIVEIIGETSGRGFKVRCLRDKVAIQVVEQTNIFWDEWFQGLFERIKTKSNNWPSFSSVRWKIRENMQGHYKNQFLRELKIAQAIALYENLLEQQERVHTETLEQRETEKAFIEEKRQELEQMQRNLEAILEQGLGEFTVI